MRKPIPDLVGQVFSRLTVIAFTRKSNNRAAWECRCACGKTKIISHGHLISGASKSCGCLQKEIMAARAPAGGASVHPATRRAYNIYLHMLDRCYNVKSSNYENYGGRGIAVCQEWRDSFSTFISDVGLPPDGLTLDREDNSKGYSKENCRWATVLQQNLNRRDNVSITYLGKTQTVSEWSKELGIHPATLYARLKSERFSGDEILSLKPKKGNKRDRYVTAQGVTKTVAEWADDLGCNKQVIISRLWSGWSEDRAVTEKPKLKGS